jgi:soluble lytic murein transglycosylase-like protein
MRKHLQLAFVASTVIATFLSLTTPYVQAETGSGGTTQIITTTTDENGRKIYENESVPVNPSKHMSSDAPAQRSALVYWSASERRWKPVPSANVRAARSAAADVSQYLGNSQAPVLDYSRGKSFTPEQVDAAIEKAAAEHNVDPSLVRAVIKVESNFNPNAVSRKGAMGLMQLMPQTARQLKVTNPFDPEQNVDAGVRHLKQLMESYGGDVKLSLAAYNAGQGSVARSGGIPHFAETRNYVKRITNLYFNGSDGGSQILGGAVHDPVRVERDARGVLYISNTD